MYYFSKKSIQILAGICAAAVVTCFASCGENSSTNANTVSDSQVTDSAGSHGENSETHRYKAYSENFTADAEILSPGREQADVLSVKRYSFDRDKIISLFFGNSKPEITEQPNGDTYFESSDGSWAYRSDAYFNYGTTHRLEVKLPFENFSSDEEFINLIPRYSQIYQKDSLDFMTPDDAVSRVKSLLESLNINVSDNVEIHAIDCETMQEYQDYVRENDPDTAKNYRIKQNLTKDDEFYYLCFSVEQDDIPVTRYRLDNHSGSSVMGSNIKVCLSKDGIFEFQADLIYAADHTERTADHLLTADEALDKAFEAYSADSSNGKTTVEQMRFEYAQISNDSNNGEVTWKPVWSLIVYQEDDAATAMEKARKNKAAKETNTEKTKGKYDITGYAEMRSVWMIDAETGEFFASSK